MKLLKRLTSIILTVAMIATLTVVPAGAADPFTVAVSSVTADAGASEVNLDISVANNPGFTAMSVRVYYKADVLTCTKVNVKKDSAGVSTAWNDFTEEEDGMFTGNPNDTQSCSTERTANGWKLASLGYVSTSAFRANGNIARLVFTIVGDAESCKSAIEVEVASCTAADGRTDVDLSTIKTVNGTITVNGVAPVLDYIELLENGKVYATGKNDDSNAGEIFLLDGKTSHTFKAKAYSTKGTDITGQVKWDLPYKFKGVTMTQSGGDVTIDVDKAAQVGMTQVTATDANNAKLVRRASIRHQRESIVPNSVTIERTDSGDDLLVPIGEETTTATFKATIKDQFGDAIDETKSEAMVDWKVTGPDGTISTNYVKFTQASGVTGTLIVTADAKDHIGTYVVSAISKYGDHVSADKTISVTVKRATAVAKMIAISGGMASLDIPATGSVDTTFTAAVTDQYGTTMTNADVKWSIEPQADGVSINENTGAVTVLPAAKNGIANTTGTTFTVTATSGKASATKTITIKRAQSVATSIKVYKNGTELTGNTDTAIVPTTDTANEYTYTAKAFDQYGAEMADTVSVSITSASSTGVTVDGNKLTVSKDAVKNTVFTVKAELGTVAPKTITVTVKDIDITWPTVTASAGTYGQKWSEIVKFNGGSASLNGQPVAGTFELVDAGAVPNVGDKYHFAFESNDGQYTVTSAEADAAIVKAPLTITAKNATVTYGEAPANNGVEYAGFVNGDQPANSLTGNLTYTYGDYAAGKDAGTYPIVPAGIKAENYKITFKNGTLTVSPKALTEDAISAIGAVTYDGTAQTPALTVKDGDKTLNVNTDYTTAYSNNTNAGTAKVVITGKGNYSGSAEKTFTIATKEITVSGVTLKDKTYNGRTDDAVVTEVTFNDLVTGEALTLGTDFTATAVYDSVDANDSADAKAQITLGDTVKANNYNLTNGTNFAATGKVEKATTTLSLSAANAVYTGTAYDESKITKTSNVETAPTYTYYTNEDCTTAVANGKPVGVGTYWVKGVIAETTNNTAAEAKAEFQITKAPLTIAAKDKTITYGDVPANDGAEYTGLVNGETADVVSGLTYAYNYEQYGNVGAYTITPKNATAANYEIKFVSGKLTVEQKEVGLTWNNAGTLYYDGKAKNVTATATGLVNDDEVTVTVAGGKQTAIGSYSAAATGLTGAKAGNYKLPAAKTQVYTIEAALTSVTVTPSTITATIGGLTIKLVGYKNGADDITVSAENANVDGDKLTINGVEYTIDKSGVKDMPTEVEVLGEESRVEKPEGAEIEDGIVNEINKAETKGEGLNEAAADKIAAADKTITETDKTDGVTKVQVKITLNIQPKSYADGKLTLNIEPKITYTYVTAGGTVVRTADAALANSDIKALVTISIKLPVDFTPNFAKHYNEMIPVTVKGGVATWQQSSFSEVTLVSDTRTATITFQKDDGSTITKIYTAANLGEALPTDSRAGHTFNGWTVGGKTYKTLTDEALTAMAALAGGARTLTASFTQNGGGSIGGGGGAATYPVSVDKAENGSVTVSPKNAAKGGTVTIEVKPDEGYELASVTVLDKDGKKLDVTLKNGKYSFVMPDGKVSIKAEFAKKGAMSFADVAANSWYYDAVKYCFDNGLMNGVGEDKFAPSATTTRAMIWTVLARDAGVDTSTGATWYEAGMKWAMENKISDGTGAENAITREQFATMLYRVAQSKGEGFTGSWYFPLSFDDAASISDWADEAMHWCVMKGILNGSNNKLNPTDNASRAEVAAMLMRFLTLDK